jgi:response regulator RpfG family c-di-GMP phosphodiesterase
MDNNETKASPLPRNVILVDSSSVSRKLFAHNIELYTGANVHIMADANEVIDNLTRNDNPKKYDLVVTENMIGDENTALKIFYTIKSQKLGIPIILIGQNPKLSGEVTEIEKEKWRDVIKTSAKLMQVKAETMMEMETPDHYSFSSYGLLFNFKTPLPLYIQKSPKEFSLWKEAGEEITKKEVRKLFFEGVEKVYVNKMLRLEFMEFLSTKLLESLKDDDLTTKERLHATGQAFDIHITNLKESGFSEKGQEGTKELLEFVVTVAASTPGLDELVELVQESQESFLYKHSLMITAFAGPCLNNLEWGNTNQVKTLVCAAFFHDMALPEDHLCAIQDQRELKTKNLKPEEIDLVEEHALKASQIIKNFSQIPRGVDDIILQHHGSLNGLGLRKDKALDNRLSPLAILFIVLEDLCCKILSENSPSIKEAVTALESEYSKGKEKKVVEALHKSFA